MSHHISKTEPKSQNIALPGNDETEVLTKSPWIHAWSDPVAGICSYSGCIKLVDLDDDGDHKLVIADANSKKLKIYKGVNLFYEAQLPEIPSWLEYFYGPPKKPHAPFIAVGCGASIYIYQKYKPFYKFTLPDKAISEQEKNIWAKLHTDTISLPDAVKALQIIQKDRIFENFLKI